MFLLYLAQTINSFYYLILDVHPSLKSNCNIVSIVRISIRRDSLNNTAVTMEPMDSAPVMKDDRLDGG